MNNDPPPQEDTLRAKTRKKAKVGSGAILAAAAASALALAASAGCSTSSTTAHCVDAYGNVLSESECPAYSSGGGYYYGGGGYRGRWVYGGSQSGSRVSGYSISPPDSGGIRTAEGHTMRGGFGGAGGEGHGFGRGGFGG